MTLAEVRDRLIADGIAEVEATYAEGSPKRDGAIEGFELCRNLAVKTRFPFERVVRARNRRERRMTLGELGTISEDAYWRHRWATLQVEWIHDCLRAASRHPDVEDGWPEKDVESFPARAVLKIVDVVEFPE